MHSNQDNDIDEKNDTEANFIKLGPWGARLRSISQSSGSRDHKKLKHCEDVWHGLTNDVPSDRGDVEDDASDAKSDAEVSDDEVYGA
eukprot:10860671-Karenia_brevis.AAC.1